MRIVLLFQAMNGFLMMATQTGKLLYISDNAAEYLGHSMVNESGSDDWMEKLTTRHSFQEDLLIHGDSVYDIIDKQDHSTIQSELLNCTDDSTFREGEKKIFLCRMNVSRNSRRQMRFGDQKVRTPTKSLSRFKLWLLNAYRDPWIWPRTAKK